MKTVDRNVITGLRFAEDVKYYNILKKNKKVTNMAKDIIGEFTDIRSESNFMKTGLKVTNEIAPRYFNLFKQAQDCMGFSEDQIIPYIQQDSSVNAACIHENDDKYLIYLTSSLLEKMNDEEILFVIGHELGHAFFKHHDLPVHGIMNSYDPPKTKDALQLLKWSRMAEISADRTGLLCCQNIEAALGSMLVLTSGLPSALLNVNIESYGKQAEEMIPNLIKNQTLDDLYSTHPFNPLRVISMKLFWDSKELYDLLKIGNNKRDLSEISIEIRKVFQLMDGEEIEHEEKDKTTTQNQAAYLTQAEECLFWGCVLVASKTNGISDDEIESILSINKNEEVAIELNRLNLVKNIEEHASKKFKESLINIDSLPQQERCSMLQKLILVARSDGKIDKEEKLLLEGMCLELSIPKDFYSRILEYL